MEFNQTVYKLMVHSILIVLPFCSNVLFYAVLLTDHFQIAVLQIYSLSRLCFDHGRAQRMPSHWQQASSERIGTWAGHKDVNFTPTIQGQQVLD